MDWMKRICQQASNMPNIRQKIGEVEKWEQDYFRIMRSLPEEQRFVLESYITACEELDHAMLCLAYQEGLESR